MNLLRRIGTPSLIILFMQLSMYPYVLQLFFGFPKENIMGIVFFAIIVLYSLFTKHQQNGMPSDLVFLMVLQCVGWFFYYLEFDDTSYITRIFFIALTFLSLSMLLWKDSFSHYLNIYCKFLTLQGVLGIVAFFLVFIGVLHPLISIATDNGYNSINFYGLTCSNAVYGNFMRIGGLFDEPGAFAFWGMFALLFNKLTVDNRKLELILILSLLFTFSAAFFVLLPIYLVCFYYKRIKSIVLALLILIPLVFGVYRALSGNSDFMYYTVERFSGNQINSTRYDQSDDAKAIFVKAPVLGVGARSFEKMGGVLVTDNPYEILAKDGIVGFIVTYIPLLYIMLKYWKKKEVVFSGALLLLDYMQRPFHINEMHYLMLYTFCLLVVLKYGRRDDACSYSLQGQK